MGPSADCSLEDPQRTLRAWSRARCERRVVQGLNELNGPNVKIGLPSCAKQAFVLLHGARSSQPRFLQCILINRASLQKLGLKAPDLKSEWTSGRHVKATLWLTAMLHNGQKHAMRNHGPWTFAPALDGNSADGASHESRT